MIKTLFSFLLLICTAGAVYLYIGNRLDEQVTSDSLLHTQQVIIGKKSESENLLVSGTLSTGSEIGNDVLIEQERISLLKKFIEEINTKNISLLITSGSNSTLYLGDQSSGIVQVSTFAGVDMYTYFLEKSDYRAPVALWGEGYTQSDFYEVMKEKGVAAKSGCVLDQDGFEVATEEYQKMLDDYGKRYEDIQKHGEVLVDDGSVDVFRCTNNKVFCTTQGCGWVFNPKLGGGDHGFTLRQESLVIN